MWKKLILTSLLAGTGLLWINAQESASDAPKVVHRPADEVFADESTGMKFGSRIGGYNKFAVSCNVNPVYGTIIRYQNEVACGDVYIYSLDSQGKPVAQKALDQEFAAVVQSIRTMPERSSLVESVTVKQETGLKLPSGVSGQCFKIRSNGEDMQSLLLMFLCKGKIIKLRVSCPADDLQEVQEALLFCKEILKLSGRN
ncbi:MAG: hypothetical protein J6C30_06830 [Lentisphaeria bacterium]|nr:hypothetical protein [Lentisphaeria bacterium]